MTTRDVFDAARSLFPDKSIVIESTVGEHDCDEYRVFVGRLLVGEGQTMGAAWDDVLRKSGRRRGAASASQRRTVTTAKKRKRACRKQQPLVLRLYRAAKKFSDGCIYSCESEEKFIDWKAKDLLDKVLVEFETQNAHVETPNE
jgi:hypothetical protein